LTRLSIFAAAREAPNRVALLTQAGGFTYSELAAFCVSRAAALAQSRDPVLLRPQRTVDSLLWLYAAWASGTPIVPLRPEATVSEGAAVQTLTGARHLPDPSSVARPQIVEREVDPEAPLAFILTSGSTGTPKLVVLSRRAALASAAASENNLGIDDDERWLLCLPLTHVAALSILVRMLAARRTVVLMESGVGEPTDRTHALGRSIREQNVTLVSLVPTLLERMLRDGFTGTPTLRAVLLGGAGCSPELADRARRAGVPLVTSYGLTETGSQVVARRYAARYSSLPQLHGCVSSGRPLAGVEIKIVAERIAVRSPALLSGYVGATTPAVDSDGWFITNDRGTIGPDGDLYVLGRIDSVIVTGGENVDPEEVERALRALPEIDDACVFGLPSVEFGQQIVAAVVAAPAALPLSLQQLTAQLALQLARFKLPRAMAVVDMLPRNAMGKLDRRACAARFGPRFHG